MHGCRQPVDDHHTSRNVPTLCSALTPNTRLQNNSINLMLRTLIFDPIVERRLVKQQDKRKGVPGAADTSPAPEGDATAEPPYWLRIFGVVATFVASGLAHEVR